MAKGSSYTKQRGVIVYNYKRPSSKSKRLTDKQEIGYHKEFFKLKEAQAKAASYGINVPDVYEKRNPTQADYTAIKNYVKKNQFTMDNNGRVNNIYVIKKYNQAVKKSNEARQGVASGILGKTKTSGGKSIKNGERYERLTKSEIKTLGGDLTSRLSEYSTERGLSDEKILAKAKTILKTANELSGKNSNSLFKKNYVKGLAQQVKDGVLSEDDYNILKRKIKGLSTADMLEWYYREEYSQIGFIYSVDEFSQQAQSQAAQGLVTSLTKFAKKKGV